MLTFPNLRKAVRETRTFVRRHIVSQSRFRHSIIQLRAAMRGARLPPGSLHFLQHQEVNADQHFYLKRAEVLGPIFKINLNGAYTTCVLGHERAMQLVAANEDHLPGVTIDLKCLFPIGAIREMTGETHQRYRRLFIEATQATPLSIDRDYSEQVIKDGLAALAQTSATVAGDAIRERLRQMTTGIMFRVLFGIREESPHFHGLVANYRRFGPTNPVHAIKDEHACAFKEIMATLREIAQDIQHNTHGSHPACFLQHFVKCGALDDTLLGNLAYLFEPAHFDVYSLWHWVLTLLASHPEVSSTFKSKLDAAARRQYAEAIVFETLRMEQSEVLYRCVTEDIVFDGFLLPAGTRLRVLLWEGHKNGAAFPSPFTFDPSRFVEQKHGREKFAPFGLGQHHCVGANLVVGLTTLFVQMLLEEYTVVASEAGPSHRGAYHWQPNPACRIRLMPRAIP